MSLFQKTILQLRIVHHREKSNNLAWSAAKWRRLKNCPIVKRTLAAVVWMTAKQNIVSVHFSARHNVLVIKMFQQKVQKSRQQLQMQVRLCGNLCVLPHFIDAILLTMNATQCSLMQSFLMRTGWAFDGMH